MFTGGLFKRSLSGSGNRMQVPVRRNGGSGRVYCTAKFCCIRVTDDTHPVGCKARRAGPWKCCSDPSLRWVRLSARLGHWCSPGSRVGGGEGEAAASQDVDAEVAMFFVPFLGLLGQDRAEEADYGLTEVEDDVSIGAAAYFAVLSFGGVVEPDVDPHILGEAGER